MKPDGWDALSEWLNAWLAADPPERDRLRARLAAERPELLAEADSLARLSAELPGFLETPALVMAATELGQDAAVLPEGSLVGPYRIEGFIARGGMGDVYRAVDTRLQRPVAIKMLAPTKTVDPQRVARFMQEARVTAAIDHPNVVKVFDVGRHDDRAYLVAEFLEGETLRARIQRGPIEVADVVRISSDIARGLQAAHAAGLVHRDLKPDNIFLTATGHTKILDFGIAKLAQDERVPDGFSTLTGVVIGTAGYLAPEQIRGAAIDARADLFALGALMFEMLTGSRLFAREHTVETLHAILHDAPPDIRTVRAGVSPALGRLVMRLLEKTPDARLQTSTAVVAALESGQLEESRPRSTSVPASLSRWGGAVARAATGVLAMAAGAIGWYQRRDTKRPAASAAEIRLAVMPFRMIPPAAENSLLEIGLADVFVSRLGQLQNVRVFPLAATERLGNRDPREAGRDLGATHVLTVNLQRDGKRVRAAAQLTAVSDGQIVWSAPVDTEVDGVFNIQDIIVNSVIAQLAPRLESDRRSRLASAGTRDRRAFDLYLRGRVLVRSPNTADLRTAADLFGEAVKLDTQYADAWAGLGSAYKRMPVVAGMSADTLVKARDAANKALTVDPNHPEAFSVLGTVAFWYDWDYALSEQRLRHALALQPSSADAQVFLAHLLSNVGRSDEAITEIRRARALDPGWMVPRALEGQFLFMARQYDDALRHLDEALKVDPRFQPTRLFRIWTLTGLGRHAEVVEACDQFLAINPRLEGSGLGAIQMKGYALARLGRTAEAAAVVDQIRAERGNAAIVLHALGRDVEAFTALRTAVAERSLAITFLGVDPRWDDVRHVPAFRDVLAKGNLLNVSNRTRR